VFEITPSFIVVTFPYAVDFERDVNGVVNGVVNGAVSKAVNEVANRREKVLTALKENNKLTKAQMTVLLGIPKTTLERDLTSLKNDKKIIRVGSDKSGYWKVIS
jgi:predicted HTH transcriptional regulator